ncbi:zinc ribbon domain-containing protein [Paenibacillus sp. CMAA1364]
MDIMDRIKSGANRVTQKAQNMVEVNKIKSHITEIERALDIYFLQMGKVFYSGYQTDDMSVAEVEIVRLSKECDTLTEEIELHRQRIAELQNERMCPCGHMVELNVNYCPHCGTKLSESEAMDKQEKVVAAKKESIRHEDLEILSVNDVDHILEEPYEEIVEKQPQDIDRERKQAEVLERERERQLELDRRIRYWKGQDGEESTVKQDSEEAVDTFKCQICAVDLPVGSKWCARCGAEQI